MLIYIIGFLASLLLTFLIRTYARKKSFLDHPNERSSHNQATPKGGGLAIILVFYVILSFFYLNGEVEESLFFALLMAIPIVVVSLIDDIMTLSSSLRLGVQIISAASALYMLGGVSTVNISGLMIEGLWLNIFSLIAIIWMTNLYNFLDGIDGYAGSETVFVGLASFLLFGSDIGLILAVTALGFLMFNWQKASIFMGDVGSAPLGFIFGILILADANSLNFIGWVLLLCVFWFDATLTVLRRAFNKEKLSQAHKKHAYQRLHQAGFSHSQVVICAMLINVMIFFLLFVFPINLHIYFLFCVITILYLLIRWIDTIKAFK